MTTVQGEYLPGTVPLVDLPRAGTGGGAIILEPQPSDDPEDPLNWPMSEKMLNLTTLLIGAILAAALNPILGTNSLELVVQLRASVDKVTMLTGYELVGVAVAALPFSATCRLFGRRHTYVIGCALMMIGSFWAASTSSYRSLVGARVVQGLGVMPFEALVQITIADMFYVHQRGFCYALYAIAYIGGAFLCPIITGVIVSDKGWHWTFGLVGGFCALDLILIVLFAKETAYVRAVKPVAQSPSQAQQVYDFTETPAAAADGEKRSGSASAVVSDQSPPADEATTFGKVITSDRGPLRPASFPQTYVSRLSPFSRRYSRQNVVSLFFRPIYLLIHPAVLWTAATQALIVDWTIGAALTAAIFYGGPPFLYTPKKIGLLYIGPFIGALIAFPLCGLLTDWFSRFVARRFARGIHEAETRLIVVVPMLVLSIIGLFGFGHYIVDSLPRGFRFGDALPSALPTSVFFACIVAAVVAGNVASGAYIGDAYTDRRMNLGVEAFVAGLFTKNLTGVAVTKLGFQWYLHQRPKRMFDTMGGVQVAVCMLSVPLWIYGKQIRRWTFNSNFWQRLIGGRHDQSV